jgi:K+-transporting ATPase KdpF subunit
MTGMHILAALLAAGLLGYLTVALLMPERFQ